MLISTLWKDYKNFINQEVELNGWIRNSRFTKNVGFIELNDGTQFKSIQIVVPNDLGNFEELGKLHLSSAISLKGIVIETPQAKQEFEIQAKEVVIEGLSTEKYPLQKKRHTFEYLRTLQHLRPRTNTFNAVFRVRSVLAFAIHKFFNERGFIYVHTPIITTSDAEGAGEMFTVTTMDLNNLPMTDDGHVDFNEDFCHKNAHLTVSGQLEGEAYSLAYKNIYTFGPTFRSEDSNTARHAAEFWMIEPEISFADLSDVCQLAEDMVKYIIDYVLKECPQDMEFFNARIDKGLIERLENVLNSSFRRMPYTEAIEILEKADADFVYTVVWG